MVLDWLRRFAPTFQFTHMVGTFTGIVACFTDLQQNLSKKKAINFLPQIYACLGVEKNLFVTFSLEKDKNVQAA